MSDAVARTNPYDYVGDIKDKYLFAGRRSELSRPVGGKIEVGGGGRNVGA